jgi:plasmid stabilization system protein ParE
MTYLVEFSIRALHDLEVLYFEKNGADSRSAEQWLNGLQGAIDGLASLPHRCLPAPEGQGAKRELRHLLYGKKPHIYRVIYEMDESRRMVNVFHIRHGAMQPLRLPEL